MVKILPILIGVLVSYAVALVTGAGKNLKTILSMQQ